MLKIKEAIIVEGIYDKIKLDSVVDATIVVTDGFLIFKDKAKQSLIKQLAQNKGVIIFTDSDSAGFKIRNFIKNFLKGENVKHAYIPDVLGKEKRKPKASKEGFLGVEGIDAQIIIKALNDANVTLGDEGENGNKKYVTKADLYSDGLSGTKDSNTLRKKLTQYLKLPSKISANMLLDVINSLYTYEEYKKIVNKIKKAEHN